jgi:hypothetical protein
MIYDIFNFDDLPDKFKGDFNFDQIISNFELVSSWDYEIRNNEIIITETWRSSNENNKNLILSRIYKFDPFMIDLVPNEHRESMLNKSMKIWSDMELYEKSAECRDCLKIIKKDI